LRDFQGVRPFPVTFTFDSKVKSLPLDLDSVTALGIVIAETVSNAYVHAFRSRAGSIRISLANDNTHAILTISDDGIGFVEPPLSKRHGLGLVRRLMEQIEGTARVVSDHGTKWTFTFPTAAAEAHPARNAA
jgi:two-component sensor histidine kinase